MTTDENQNADLEAIAAAATAADTEEDGDTDEAEETPASGKRKKRVKPPAMEQPTPEEIAQGYMVRADGNGDERMTILYSPAALARNESALDMALLDRPDLLLFQRSGELVRVKQLTDKVTVREGAFIYKGAMTIRVVSRLNLQSAAMKAADFAKFDARSNAWIKGACPKELAEQYVDRYDSHRTMPLAGIIGIPIMRADGTLRQESGYDYSTELYAHLEQPIPSLPEITPENAESLAKAAYETMLRPTRRYPWADGASRAAYASLLLTALTRHLLLAGGCPMVLITAPDQGAGKGKLATIAGVFRTGKPGGVINFVPDENEMEKRFGALFLSGAQVIVLDEVEGKLDDRSLRAICTAVTWEARILGRTEHRAFPTTSTVVVALGNNIEVAGESTSRTLVVRIEPRESDFTTRQFDFDPVTEAERDRPELVQAAFTLLRAHAVAGYPSGRPKGEKVTPTRFPDWDRLVRAAVVWASGGHDPARTIEESQAADEGRNTDSAIFELWTDAFPALPWITAAEALESLRERVARLNRAPNPAEIPQGERAALEAARKLLEALYSAMPGGATLTALTLAKWLQKRKGRTLGDRRLTCRTSRGNREWRIYFPDLDLI